MGNIIATRDQPPERWVRLSNGATDAVLGVLVIAGSDLAATPWQRRLISWLAGRDQTIFGRGAVGFDLEDLGWSKADFAAEQEFLRRVIATAATGHRWAALGYEPRREVVIEHLARLDALVRDLPHGAADQPTDRFWPDGDPTALCPAHRVLLHPDGCLLCNDR